ncbi:MAG: L-lactate dehydrogenase [Promethearchaeota archaeon CR_4]|nr:MAG: L-lactate dehydrogenase [Candidatus Lokiarchaeota archaeon CR_4]
MRYNPKISVIGAGNVGIRYTYSVIIRGLARHIVLVDVNKKRAEGEAMDLSHGAPYYNPVQIEAGEYPAIENSDLVVITAGRNQNPGESRLDLIKDNTRIYAGIIPKCVQYAPTAKYLVVSNPVDVLSYVTYKLSGKPASEVIGAGTVLDSARFRFLLGSHCGLDPRNVHAYILGEHGDSEFPVWSNAMIGGMPIREYCNICAHNSECQTEEILDDIFNEARDAAHQIISRKGETSYGIGLALARITSAILNDENTILPVSTLINDFLGVSSVYLSLPALINKGGVKQVIKPNLSTKEREQFQNSAVTIRKVLDAIHFN